MSEIFDDYLKNKFNIGLYIKKLLCVLLFACPVFVAEQPKVNDGPAAPATFIALESCFWCGY